MSGTKMAEEIETQLKAQGVKAARKLSERIAKGIEAALSKLEEDRRFEIEIPSVPVDADGREWRCRKCGCKLEIQYEAWELLRAQQNGLMGNWKWQLVCSAQAALGHHLDPPRSQEGSVVGSGPASTGGG